MSTVTSIAATAPDEIIFEKFAETDWTKTKGVNGERPTRKFDNGLIIGAYSDDVSFFWSVALNAEHEFVAAEGLTKLRDTAMAKESNGYIAGLMSEKTRSDDKPSINKSFAVNNEHITELGIDKAADVAALCFFAANCYHSSPHVIDAMRQGNFSLFKRYRDAEAVISSLEMNHPGQNMTITLAL